MTARSRAGVCIMSALRAGSEYTCGLRIVYSTHDPLELGTQPDVPSVPGSADHVTSHEQPNLLIISKAIDSYRADFTF